MMSKLSLMAYGKEDTKTSLRHRVGSWLLKQAVRIIPLESLKVYHYRQNGFDGEKHRIVLSTRRVDYNRDFAFEDGHPMWIVRHEDDGVLGAFLFWKDAMSAASTLSQEFDDYHFRESVLDEDSGKVIHAEEHIEGLEPNLFVEESWAYREFDWHNWRDSTHITGDTVRTVEEVKQKHIEAKQVEYPASEV